MSIAATFTANAIAMGSLALLGILQLAIQRRWRFALQTFVFYCVVGGLLYLIRFYSFNVPLISEFFLLTFWIILPMALVGWDLITTPPGEMAATLSKLRMPTPFILGVLVIFRFFPTIRSELGGVIRSMKNRGLTEPTYMLRHPFLTAEHIFVPILLRILQIADQLSVSAVSRGATNPQIRGSYYQKEFEIRDAVWMLIWVIATIAFLIIGGLRF